MRRMLVIFALIALALGGLITYRLQLQAAELEGPSGGSGEIEGIELDLAARVSARVLQLHVDEGAAVKKGDLLVTLDSSETSAALAEAEARVAAAEAQVRASRAQVMALAAQRGSVKRQAERLEALASDVAAASRDQTRASAEGLDHQVAAAEAQVLAAQEQARAGRAAVERARLLLDETSVRAPRDGVVEELPHEVGELVAPGQAVARLIDLREVRATFYLPNAEIAAGRPGARAVVVADAYPDERFLGVVSTVAAHAEFTPRNIQTRTDRDRLVYPVEVTLANPEGKLRPGMPVQVTLPGTER